MAEDKSNQQTNEALLADLGIDVEAEKPASYTVREERIIAGFEDIQRFYREHGRLPQHGEDRDIFERIYATRLDRIADQADCRDLLVAFDTDGLLERHGAQAPTDDIESLDDEAVLAALGVAPGSSDDITTLTHVVSRAEKKAAEEIATRERCEDFDQFEPLFDQVQADLDKGERVTLPFKEMAEIRRGQWFIVEGQKAYIAEIGEEFMADYGRRDSRLRVIYDNGTENQMLLRSFQRALHRDDLGRRISEHDSEAGPLFEVKDEAAEYLASGTVYVLRSLSENPQIADKRNLLHKIGVTGGKVETRIQNASNDPTFLLADVEIVATYQLFNIHRHKLERLIHRVLEPARLDVAIQDRFGKPVKPREWFLVPLPVIDQMIERIQDGSITEYRYDPATASLEQDA